MGDPPPEWPARTIFLIVVSGIGVGTPPPDGLLGCACGPYAAIPHATWSKYQLLLSTRSPHFSADVSPPAPGRGPRVGATRMAFSLLLSFVNWRSGNNSPAQYAW